MNVIAMHGWAGEAAQWDPWREATAPMGWNWSCGERGYGLAPPFLPCWLKAGIREGAEAPPRLLITHSLGVHLLPPSLLGEAGAGVLLAGFGRFLPPGRDGRRLRVALQGMAAALEEGETEAERARRAQVLLRSFLAEAAAPEPEEAMPPGLADRPVPAPARRRLRQDLDLLAGTVGLPRGFPDSIPILIVEAGEDRIVVPAARSVLRQALPKAEVILLPGAGHALLRTPVIPLVLDWVRQRGWR